MALLGYARVSTNQQKLDLQIPSLLEADVRGDRILTDMMTGSTDNRDGLQKLLTRAERERILERTNDGRQAAMGAGVKFGRMLHKGTDLAKKLINQGMASKDVIEKSGVSRATYFRVKKKAR